MTHYLLAVHGPAEMGEFGNYSSKEEMDEAFAATGVFNDQLRADGIGSSPAGSSRHRRRPSWTGRVTRRSSPMARTWRPRRSSAASGSSTHPTSTWRSGSRRRGPRHAAAKSRCVRSRALLESAL